MSRETNDPLNSNVLVLAKEEYTKYLIKYLSPIIFEGFVALWDDAFRVETEEYTYEYKKKISSTS